MTFNKFVDSIDKYLGRDDNSLHLFEWVVEDLYESRIKNNLDYYIERPDLLHINNEEILIELSQMLKYFESIDEFEKCMKIQKIQKDIKETISNI